MSSTLNYHNENFHIENYFVMRFCTYVPDMSTRDAQKLQPNETAVFEYPF